jgi:hypothetical protein
MSELSIGHVRSLFHKNEPNRGFVEQVVQQIEKDASGLGELPRITINWEQPLLPQLVTFVQKVEEAIVAKGNDLSQFYYRVDLPESLVKNSASQSSVSELYRLQELVLMREAQKVMIRNFYRNQTRIED